MSKCLPGLVALGMSIVPAPSPACDEEHGSPRGLPITIEVGQEQPPVDWLDSATYLRRAELVETVLARNPSLEAAYQAWLATLERTPQAAALSDPTLAYSLAPLSIGSSETSFGQKIELSQPLPYPGVRRNRAEEARALAAVSGGTYESLRHELALAASLLFDDYFVVGRALEVNAEHVRLLEEFLRIATVRYSAGLVPQSDPLQAEVELARLAHRAIELESRKRVVQARLNALLHRAPRSHLPPPPTELAPPGTDPLEQLLTSESERLQELALSSRPELAAAAAGIAAGEAALGLAKLEGRPEFAATTSYTSMWNATGHRWMVGVGVNLPVWRGRVKAGVAEAEARLAAAHSRQLGLEDEIRAGVDEAHTRLHETRHIVTLYGSRLLPAARDQLRAATIGFETSQNSFLVLIEAEKNLRAVELGHHLASADYHRRLAEAAHAVGLSTDEVLRAQKPSDPGPPAEVREGAIR